jgi:penicillin-binding protein 1A
MEEQGKSDVEIIKSFSKKTPMSIFSWTAQNNSKDTIMTPMDSIRYYKSILQASLMSMTPQTGEVKAWVGGIRQAWWDGGKFGAGKRERTRGTAFGRP